jgi:hypothetical protein
VITEGEWDFSESTNAEHEMRFTDYETASQLSRKRDSFPKTCLEMATPVSKHVSKRRRGPLGFANTRAAARAELRDDADVRAIARTGNLRLFAVRADPFVRGPAP